HVRLLTLVSERRKLFMSLRRLTVWLTVSLLCVLGTFLTAVAKPPEKEACPEPERPKLITLTYQVADLVVPIDEETKIGVVNLVKPSVPTATDAKVPEQLPTPTPAPQPAVANPPRPSKTLENQLIRLITSTVRPQSWDEMGGSGHVEYYPLGMALVV